MHDDITEIMKGREIMRVISMLVIFVVGIILSTIPVKAEGNHEAYYVDEKNGNDINDGTSDTNAVKTIQRAMEVAKEGSVIYVMSTLHVKNDLTIHKSVEFKRYIEEGKENVKYLFIIEKGHVILEGCILDGNRFELEQRGVNVESALVRVNTDAKLTIRGETVLRNNNHSILTLDEDGKMSAGGGAIMGQEGSHIHLESGSIENNHTVGLGGGIDSHGYLEISGGSVQNNTCDRNGAGIYHDGSGAASQLKMSGGKISENETLVYSTEKGKEAGFGGGISVNNSTNDVEISGGEIEGNRAFHSGGIRLADATLNMSGETKIQGNIALEKNGGGIGGRDYILTINGGSVVGNKSLKGNGGGIQVADRSVATIHQAYIAKNQGKNYGGGVYVANDSFLTITGTGYTQITENMAKYGGGIVVGYNEGTTSRATLTDYYDQVQKKYCPVIHHNTATSQGGGIFSKDQVVLKNAGVASNQAEEKGSGIYTEGRLFFAGNVEVNPNNDVYLAQGTYVEVREPLVSKVAGILTPSEYALGRCCVRITYDKQNASEVYQKFELNPSGAYLLRPGDYMGEESGIGKKDVVISRPYEVTYHKNTDYQVEQVPEKDVKYWNECYRISNQLLYSEKGEFLGWNFKKDAERATYAPGTYLEWNHNKDIVLYAIWKWNTPPQLYVKDSYLMEYEIDTLFGVDFLKKSAKAEDVEDGDISGQIIVKNWDNILQNIEKDFSEEERGRLERVLEVVYEVEDSKGEKTEKTALLHIYLMKEEEPIGYVRFISQAYVDDLKENTKWGSAENKSYLQGILEESWDTIEWETIE